MVRASARLLVSILRNLAAVSAVGCALVSMARGQTDAEAYFQESIQEIRFVIDVGDQGVGLDEPVALDLGLGFPLWLRVDNNPNETAAFPQLEFAGAVSEEWADGQPVAPGASATFTFRKESGSGWGNFQFTSRLLKDVLVSDIGRVGLISKGESHWQLEGYELLVNGKLFAKRNGLNLFADQEVDRARLDQVELRAEIGANQQERDDLQAILDAGLGESADRQRMATLEGLLTEPEIRIRQLQRIADISFPWYVDDQVDLMSRGGSPKIGRASVTLLTAPHGNSRTSNRLYFSIGGHKYFLSSATGVFEPEANPQSFDLDLLSGPLIASDIRGYGIGMLAGDDLGTAAPDRWHPQRIIVEIDGRVTYDSDQQSVDIPSLNAIRLVPPAHRDEQGNVIVNNLSDREVAYWRSGQAQGLNLESGGMAETSGTPPVPEKSEPSLHFDSAIAPPPPSGESEPIEGSIGGQGSAVGMTREEGWFPGEGPCDCPPEGWGMPLGPSEGMDYFPTGSSEIGGEPQWMFPADAGANIPGGDSVPFTPEDRERWTSLEEEIANLRDLVQRLLDQLGRDMTDAEAIGTPPQIDNVHIIQHPDDPKLFRVAWDVTGDESSIERYNVTILERRSYNESIGVTVPTGVGIVEVASVEVDAGSRVTEWLRLEGTLFGWFCARISADDSGGDGSVLEYSPFIPHRLLSELGSVRFVSPSKIGSQFGTPDNVVKSSKGLVQPGTFDGWRGLEVTVNSDRFGVFAPFQSGTETVNQAPGIAAVYRLPIAGIDKFTFLTSPPTGDDASLWFFLEYELGTRNFFGFDVAMVGDLPVEPVDVTCTWWAYHRGVTSEHAMSQQVMSIRPGAEPVTFSCMIKIPDLVDVLDKRVNVGDHSGLNIRIGIKGTWTENCQLVVMAPRLETTQAYEQ